MKHLIALILVLVAGSMISGCASYVELSDLKLVAKNYPKPDEVSNLSFALAEPELKIRYNLTTTANSGLSERIKYDVNKVSCFLTDEEQKILLSKGFTITDTFQSYNAMTFTQKRNTSALFYPEIAIEIEEKSQLERISAPFYSKHEIKGRLQINAKVNIIMLEPLSGEKLWVKSIPVTGFDEPVTYKPEEYDRSALNSYTVPEDLAPIAVKIDNMITTISQDVLEATAKYVERHEFEFLNADIIRLKGIKRY